MALTLILLRVLSRPRGSSDNEVHSGPLQPPSESRMETSVLPEDDDGGDDIVVMVIGPNKMGVRYELCVIIILELIYY